MNSSRRMKNKHKCDKCGKKIPIKLVGKPSGEPILPSNWEIKNNKLLCVRCKDEAT